MRPNTFTVNGCPVLYHFIESRPCHHHADLTAVTWPLSIQGLNSHTDMRLKDNVVQASVGSNRCCCEHCQRRFGPFRSPRTMDGLTALRLKRTLSLTIPHQPFRCRYLPQQPSILKPLLPALNCSDPDEVPAMSYQWLIGTTVVGSGIALIWRLSVAPWTVTCLVTATMAVVPRYSQCQGC